MAEKRTYEDIANKLGEIANASLETVKTALRNKNIEEYGKAMAKLTADVQALNGALCNVAFNAFMQTDNPLITAIKQFTVDTCKIKEEKSKETGAIVGVLFEKKASRINLEKFCEFGGLDKGWLHDVSKLLQLLQLRETDVFAIKPDELAKKSYFFINAAKKKADGETPDSNTQIVRLLQTIMDKVIFVDDGSGVGETPGKNVHKCTNHDIAFIQEAAFQFDAKQECGLKSMNERQFQTVMMSVFYKSLTGKAYGVKNATLRNAE